LFNNHKIIQFPTFLTKTK